MRITKCISLSLSLSLSPYTYIHTCVCVYIYMYIHTYTYMYIDSMIMKYNVPNKHYTQTHIIYSTTK